MEKLEAEIENQFFDFIPSTKLEEGCRELTTKIAKFKEHGDVNIKTLLDVSEKLHATCDKAVNRQIATILIASFLWIYESVYIFSVDFFCYLLINNGHDLFDSIRRKYAFSFEEISRVDASTKLEFLAVHNLEMFKRDQDRKLRNKIAHHDFTLNDEGIIKVGGVEIKIMERIKDLLRFTRNTFFIFDKCLNKYVK